MWLARPRLSARDDVVPMRRRASLVRLERYAGPLWIGLSVAGLIVLARLYVVGDLGWIAGSDLQAYWGVDPAAPYDSTVGTLGAFLYSPVAALAAQPLHILPFDVVRVLWWLAGFACLAWMTGRWALAWLLFLPVAGDLYTGNIHLMLAAAIVLGMRRPVAWSFVLLTKVTPGIGLVWFAVRREWRPLGWALVATSAFVVLSLLVVPSWWPAWVGVLTASASGPPDGSPVLLGIPLWMRVALAACLVAWGASRDRAWTVPVGAALALPTVWLISPAMLVGAVPLLAGSPRHVREGRVAPEDAGTGAGGAQRITVRARRSSWRRLRAGSSD